MHNTHYTLFYILVHWVKHPTTGLVIIVNEEKSEEEIKLQ